jgi:hypothetical protein
MCCCSQCETTVPKKASAIVPKRIDLRDREDHTGLRKTARFSEFVAADLEQHPPGWVAHLD